MGTVPGLDHQKAAGWVFGLFWNRTEPLFWFKPGPLAGYLDPLLTLARSASTNWGNKFIGVQL